MQRGRLCLSLAIRDVDEKICFVSRMRSEDGEMRGRLIDGRILLCKAQVVGCSKPRLLWKWIRILIFSLWLWLSIRLA